MKLGEKVIDFVLLPYSQFCSLLLLNFYPKANEASFLEFMDIISVGVLETIGSLDKDKLQTRLKQISNEISLKAIETITRQRDTRAQKNRNAIDSGELPPATAAINQGVYPNEPDISEIISNALSSVTLRKIGEQSEQTVADYLSSRTNKA